MIDLVHRAIALAGSPLFEALEPEPLLEIAERARSETVAAGAVLFARGDDSETVFVVVRGRLVLEREGGVREELGPGQLAGELPALEGEPRGATATALEACELVRIEPDHLIDILSDHPEVVRALALNLARRVRASAK